MGVDSELGKVSLVLNKDCKEETKKTIETFFKNRVDIIVDTRLEHIDMEVQRDRDWTVLGGGIGGATGTTMSDRAATIGAIGVKDGKYFLITSGHVLPEIGKNYYQFGSKVGVSHTNAAYYNSSDIGLIRIEDAHLQSSTSSYKVPRRVSNKLYLDDKYNSNYSGSITSVHEWPAVNDVVEKSGASTGITQGRIVNTYDPMNYESRPGYPTTYGVKVEPINSSRYSNKGDSGSPTYKENKYSNDKAIMGIHAAGDEVNGYFSPAHQFKSSFGEGFSIYTQNYETIIH